MNNYQYALSIEVLALRGILDEFTNFYNELRQIVESAYHEAKQDERFNLFSSLAKYDKYCKKPLNEFIQKHITLFTYDYPHLYINDWCMHSFSMFDVRKTGSLSFAFEIISFKRFLETVELIAARALFVKIQKNRPKISFETVLNLTNEHINKIFFYDKKFCQNTILTDDFPKITHIDNVQAIYVYNNTNNINCIIKNHSVSNKTLAVPLLNGTHYLKLPVKYCYECDRHFISIQTVEAFESVYGKLIIKTVSLLSSEVDYSRFAAESELHSWGYNVINSKMSENDRHQLIELLIRFEYMNLDSICRDIENAIRIFSNNEKMQQALEKWKSDLVFVRQLTITNAKGFGKLSQNKTNSKRHG